MGERDLSEAKALTVWPLTGGQVNDTSSTLIPDNAWQSTTNIVGYEGKVRPRSGFNETLLDLGAVSAKHLTRIETLAGVTTKAAVSHNVGAGTGLFWEWTSPTWTDRSGAITLTVNSDDPVTSCNFKGVLYFTTAGSNLHKWTGAGNNIAEVTNGDAAITPFTIPKFIVAWSSRLFMFNCGEVATRYAYRAAWSDFNLDNVWRGGVNGGSSGYQDLIDSGNDDPVGITAAAATNASIYAFKPTAIFRGYFVDYPKFYQFDPLIKGIGCPAHLTLKKFRDMLLFLGDDNVYALEDGAVPKPVGEKVRPRIETLINAANMHKSVAFVDPATQLYWLFVPKTGTSTMITLFIFSLRDGGTWWEGEIANTGILPVCSYSERTSAWDYTHIVGSTTGQFFDMDSSYTDDDGAAFTAQGTLKRFDALRATQAAAETARFVKLGVHAGSGKITAKVSTGGNLDSMTTAETIGTLTFNGKSDKYLALRHGDRFADITLTWDMTSVAQVEGLTLHVLPRGSVR